MIIDIYKHDQRKQCFNKDKRFHNSYGSSETHYDGYKVYDINGKFHNIHGPAVFHPENDVTRYCLNNYELTKEQWEIRRHDY